ncbi:hypothetical protein V2J09_000868 [Rumex salicifolius]
MSISNQSRSLLLFFLSLFIFFLRSSSSSSSKISYSAYCSHIVPESTRSDPYSPSPSFLQLSNAYAANAKQLLGPSASQINAHFKPNSVFRTQTPQILQIDGTLQLRVSRVWGFSQNATGRRLYRVYGGPRLFQFGGAVDFQLSGFWSSSGRLCMVGSGQLKDLRFNVVFKLDYPNNSVIATSLASGRLESLDSESVAGFFRPISVLGFSRMNYEFSLVKEKYAVKSPGSLHKSNGDCFSLISLSDQFEIEYGGSCQGNSCTLPGRLFGYLPKFMSVNVIDCSTDPFVRFSLELSNSSSIHNGFAQPFNPANTLVAEGIWNENRNQVRAVACSIFMNSSGNASIEECWIGLSFTLSSVLSIRWRSLIDGQMWSYKNEGDVGYFNKIQIRTSAPRMWALPGGHSVPDGYSSQLPTIKHLGTLNQHGQMNNSHSDLFPHRTNEMPKGTIESKRPRTDPLYFDQLSLKAVSITERQARKSVWRMDLEMSMQRFGGNWLLPSRLRERVSFSLHLPPAPIKFTLQSRLNREMFLFNLNEIPDGGYEEQENEFNEKPFVGQAFSCQEEAYASYQNYARNHGFLVRKDRTIKKDGKMIRRDFYCNGARDRPSKIIHPSISCRNKPLSRCGCTAHLRITLRRPSEIFPEWHVTTFNDDHNHELLSLEEMRFLPAVRTITDADKDRILLLKEVGLTIIRQIVRVMELEKNNQKMNLSTIDQGFIKSMAYMRTSTSKVYNGINEMKDRHLYENMLASYKHTCLGSLSPMEQNTNKLLTPFAFKKFHEEFEKATRYSITNVNGYNYDLGESQKNAQEKSLIVSLIR